ncbi:MAG: ABC transporter permease [Spirochaetes bacterium]|nr:ABC transporter permease [Spirochaetota bacterium]
MRKLYFIFSEIRNNFKKTELIIPQLFSLFIPILMFYYGYSKMGYFEYSKIIISGYLFSQLLSISSTAVIFLTVDLTIGSLNYYFSLPFSSKEVISMKFISSYFLSFVLGLLSFSLSNLILYKIFDYRLIYIVLLILIQIILLTGFICILTIIIKDITKLGLILSISSTVLIYFSPVYFSEKIFNPIIKKIIYLNPLYFPIVFLRQLINNFFDIKIFIILIFQAFLYQFIAFLMLHRRVVKSL